MPTTISPGATARRLALALVVACTVWLTCAPVLACKANPLPFTETQPDGTQIVLRFRGDKYFHWHEDMTGRTVLRRNDGYYVYATLDAAGLLAETALRVGVDAPDDTVKPGILPDASVRRAIAMTVLPEKPWMRSSPGRSVPPLGEVKNLVVLARFADHTGRTLPTDSDINVLFNTVGGDPDLAPTGSVRDVYFSMSYGQMTLVSTVCVWVTVPETEAFYTNGVSGLGEMTHDLIRDALELVDPVVDFSEFDTDKDGFVDSIAFMHSGYAAEFGGTDAFGTPSSSRMWSHRWSLNTGEFVSDEGPRVFDYHINPAVWGTSGSVIGRIGVISHETGHFFGLPDLYDTSGTGEGAGSWCMMANSWGFSGNQRNPPTFSPWSKMQLGWVTPTLIDTPGVKTLDQVQTNAQIHMITAGFPTDEFLLIENRNRAGFDINMPVVGGGGGLAVWHIDEQASFSNEGFPGQEGWPENGQHYRVALLQADGLYDLEQGNDRGDAGDVYRASAVNELNGTTLPSTDTYQNGLVAETGISISAISAGGPTMTYTLGLDSTEVSVFDGATEILDGGGPISFGTAQQGDAALTKTFTVQNSGTLVLNVTGMTVPVGYQITETLATSIAAGGSDSFTVSRPTASAGTFAGTIQFTNNDSDENPFNFTVTATITAAPAPEIVVANGATNIADGVGALSFGSTSQGSTAPTRTLRVSNSGTGTLTLGTPNLPAGYSITESLNASIAAGTFDEFTISLSTATVGTFSGQISFSTNDANENPFNFSLNGTITEPLIPEVVVQDGATNIADGGGPIDFGTTTQGGAALTRTFTVRNTGTGPLSTSGLTLPTGYTLVEGLSASVVAGGSDTFIVRLPSTIAGTFAGDISFTCNDADEGAFNFSVTGTVTGPEIRVFDKALELFNNTGVVSFGTITRGDEAASKTFTVSNIGTSALNLSNLSVPSGFVLETGLPASVAAGGDADFTVALDTASTGQFTGTISFATNDSDENPFIIQVTGTVTDPGSGSGVIVW